MPRTQAHRVKKVVDRLSKTPARRRSGNLDLAVSRESVDTQPSQKPSSGWCQRKAGGWRGRSTARCSNLSSAIWLAAIDKRNQKGYHSSHRSILLHASRSTVEALCRRAHLSLTPPTLTHGYKMTNKQYRADIIVAFWSDLNPDQWSTIPAKIPASILRSGEG